jgi:hypothetical protein
MIETRRKSTVASIQPWASSKKKRFAERVLRRTVRVVPLSLPVRRSPVWRTLSVMSESHPFTPVVSPPMCRNPAHDRVSRFSSVRNASVASDSSLFMPHSISMRRNIIALMSSISGLMSLINAQLFHIITAMPDISARTIVISALLSLTIRVMPVMAARITNTTAVMSDIAQVL